jgi:hypothetical protein
MDPFLQPGSLYAFTAWLLLQLLHDPHYSAFKVSISEAENDDTDQLSAVVGCLAGPLHDANNLFSAGLQNYRLCTTFTMFDEDVSFWVRPRSTTW